MFRTNRALSEMDGVCSMRGSGFSSHRPLYKRICPTALYAPISVKNELTHLSLLGLARLRLSPVSLIVDMDAGSERDSIQTKNTIHTHVSSRWSTDEEMGGGVALTRTLSTAPARAGASQPSVASATTGFLALAARERENHGGSHHRHQSTTRAHASSSSLSVRLGESPSPAAPAAARIEPPFSASVRTKPGVDGSAAPTEPHQSCMPTRASTHASTGWPIAHTARRASRRRPRAAATCFAAMTPVSQAACMPLVWWLALAASVGRSLSDLYSICQRAISVTARRPAGRRLMRSSTWRVRWDPSVDVRTRGRRWRAYVRSTA
jgi:hypothetical protein